MPGRLQSHFVCVCVMYSLVSIERYSSAWYGVVRFETVRLDLACVSTVDSILTRWAVLPSCAAHHNGALPLFLQVKNRPISPA